MKKITALLLGLMLLAGVTACGDSSSTPPPSEIPAPTSIAAESLPEEQPAPVEEEPAAEEPASMDLADEVQAFVASLSDFEEGSYSKSVEMMKLSETIVGLPLSSFQGLENLDGWEADASDSAENSYRLTTTIFGEYGTVLIVFKDAVVTDVNYFITEVEGKEMLGFESILQGELGDALIIRANGNDVESAEIVSLLANSLRDNEALSLDILWSYMDANDTEMIVVYSYTYSADGTEMGTSFLSFGSL